METSNSVIPSEVEQFASHAGDWWDPAGSEAMLHRLNPVRLAYIRDQVDQHWGLDERSFRPLEGKTALDVGCGAGLLAEPLARLGAEVTGVDAAEANVAVARAHAEGASLPIDYRHGELAALGLGRFDLVTAMEVLEHVADKPAFLAELANHLSPSGLLALSTPNRTARSRLLMVGLAETVGAIPRGTHHWDDFVTPDELRELLAEAGLKMGTPRGLAFTPAKGLHLSDDLSLNYLATATAA